MKTGLIITFTFFLVAAIHGQSLSVIVSNVKNSKGYVRVAVYNSKDGFMKKHVAIGEARAAEGQVTVTINKLRDGEYALSVMHDSNNNEKLDTNLIGLPREGFAFSNDAMGTIGPPTFKEASFVVQGPTAHAVRLRYY